MVTQLGCVSETAIDSKAGSGSTISSLRARLFKVFDISLNVTVKRSGVSSFPEPAEMLLERMMGVFGE